MAPDDRLKQVHQTDLTESRVNEDFVLWLKTKGPQYLLMAMIVVCAYLGVVRWKQYRAQHFSKAWVAYLECSLPGAFEDVADQYADVPGLKQQAWRSAADTLLQAVQTGRRLGAEASTGNQAPENQLSDEQRLDYLAHAERLYRSILDTDDKSLKLTLFVVSAYQGLAAIAESRGDGDEARRLYEVAATRAEPFYPLLAERVRRRAATVGEYLSPVNLPNQAARPSPPARPALEPAAIDPGLASLLPAGSAAATGGTGGTLTVGGPVGAGGG